MVQIKWSSRKYFVGDCVESIYLFTHVLPSSRYFSMHKVSSVQIRKSVKKIPHNVKYFFHIEMFVFILFFRRHFEIVKCEYKWTISSENRNLFRLFSDLMEHGIESPYRSIDSTLSTEDTMSICNILLPFSSCHFNITAENFSFFNE